MIDLLRLGFFGMRTRPVRAVLSALGIAIGIAAVVAVVGIPASSAAALQEKMSKLGTNLLTAAPGQDFFGQDAKLPETAVPMAKRIGAVSAASATGRSPRTSARTTSCRPATRSGCRCRRRSRTCSRC